MNILFVCKYNKFRSQIAGSYFKSVNKNKKIKAKSRGMLVGSYPLDKIQVSVAKKLGIIIKNRPKPITTKLLKKQDLIIIVANDVPKQIFMYEGGYPRKTIVWNIPDEQEGRVKRIKKTISMIKLKVDKLAEDLQDRK